MTLALRVFHIRADGVIELEGVPATMPPQGFLWMGYTRAEFEARHAVVQEHLIRLAGGPLVDLHAADLLSHQLPSHFDSTSLYDILIVRRLLALPGEDADTHSLPSIDTSPMGFVVFDRLLLSVHPDDCAVRDFFAQRMTRTYGGTTTTVDAVRGTARLPVSAADLMLRMVNHIVDSYLDLRRRLTRQLTELQQDLLSPKAQFHDWSVLLDARTKLHVLEDSCEDQRSAVQEWIDALDEWPTEATEAARRERELLRVRSRDVLEHIERVLTHVRRLEQSAEAAVQMHFSALSHRTNQIMRTLTVLTAIFLPLNLITGFFGMNFDALPLIHDSRGVWLILGLMVLVAIGLATHFWRKRYLSTAR
jgi:magnesium transporter